MMRPIYRLFNVLIVAVLLASCNKDELDAMYGKPKDLAPPIYEQLQAKGKFKNMLAVIDKAGYRDILKAGYWTLFAPNDEAFAIYLQEKGFSDVNQLNKEEAGNILRISLVYNSYLRNQISTFESPENQLIPNAAFRRKTAYYDFVYEENGRKIVAANGNTGVHIISDNNNKHIPVFTREFMDLENITDHDYNAFYPNTPIQDFNVAGAQVKETDIVAENGIIHEIDKVLYPDLSFERYLAKDDYSEFRKLLETNVLYSSHYMLTNRYKALTGNTDEVFVKFYTTNGVFSPGNENYLGTGSTDGQAGSYSLMVPKNDVLLAYKAKLLEDWEGKQLTPEMTAYLINAHMYPSTLWPSKIAETRNGLGELGSITKDDIVEQKMLSNGPFYGIKKVQPANAFRTVYSRPFLNSKYLLQTRGFNRSIRSQLIDMDRKWGLFMHSDKQFEEAGYRWNEVIGNYSYRDAVTNITTVSDVARDRFLRILYSTVFDNSFLNVMDLSGEGVLKGSKGEGEESEYIHYKNNIIKASGNFERGTEVRVDSMRMTDNGPVFYTTGTLLFAEKPIGAVIKQLATEKPLIYGDFYNYLTSLSLINTSTNQINGVVTGVNYTVFIPTNAAIRSATSGLPLKADGSPEIPPANSLAREKLVANILYHFVEKRTFAPDGDPEKSGTGTTVFKDIDQIDPNTFVSIRNIPGMLYVRGARNTEDAQIIPGDSNKFANRTLIHSINKVLLIKQ